MNEYTPTTEQVRKGYAMNMRDTFVASTGELEAEFDRWMLTLVPAATPSVDVYASEPSDAQVLARIEQFAQSEGVIFADGPRGEWLPADALLDILGERAS